MEDVARVLLEGRTFLTNGGTETYLLFQQGFPLREGCAFEVFHDDASWDQLQRHYLAPILSAAQRWGHGILLDALVWRAHPDFVARLGYAADALAKCNALAVARTRAAVEAWRSERVRDGMRADVPVLIAADLGPRGDGYRVADQNVTPEAAYGYHRAQIEALAGTGVDVLCATTMTSVAESIGIVRAATEHGIPTIVSPTVETDGKLPDGMVLGDLIRTVDDATAGAPLFYMVNCAHPTHLGPTLERAKAEGARWLERFRGFRANASPKSHAELDDSPELDRGDPGTLAREVADMQQAYDLCVIGGCCGTDAEHIAAIAKAAAERSRARA
jgi:homocysteine S-methyltransferase